MTQKNQQNKEEISKWLLENKFKLTNSRRELYVRDAYSLRFYVMLGENRTIHIHHFADILDLDKNPMCLPFSTVNELKHIYDYFIYYGRELITIEELAWALNVKVEVIK